MSEKSTPSTPSTAATPASADPKAKTAAATTAATEAKKKPEKTVELSGDNLILKKTDGSRQDITAQLRNLDVFTRMLDERKISIPPNARVEDTIVVDNKGQIVWGRPLTREEVLGMILGEVRAETQKAKREREAGE